MLGRNSHMARHLAAPRPQATQATGKLAIHRAARIVHTGTPVMYALSALRQDAQRVCASFGINLENKQKLPIIANFACADEDNKTILKFRLAQPLSYRCDSYGIVVQYVSENNIGEHQYVSIKYTSDQTEFNLAKELESGGNSTNCGQIKC